MCSCECAVACLCPRNSISNVVASVTIHDDMLYIYLKNRRDEAQNMNTLWKVINIYTCAYTYAHIHIHINILVEEERRVETNRTMSPSAVSPKIAETEQLHQAQRMIGGIGNVLFSRPILTLENRKDPKVSCGEPLKHVITVRGQILVSRTDYDPCSPCVASKTLPCARSKRLRVYRHHAHMLQHMCAWCRHTRVRFERTHGDVFEPTHVFFFFTFFFSACRNTHTHEHTHTHTKHTTTTKQHHDHNTQHHTETERERERERETEKERQDKTRGDGTRQDKKR